MRELSADDPSYVQVVREWFQSQGNSPKEVRITRILQTDMEGDGVDEVLLSASYFQDTSGQTTSTSDYSVVLMRKVVGNAVVTVPLAKKYYVSSGISYTYTLAEAFDLNSDGTLEVLVSVIVWEGKGASAAGQRSGTIVYRVDGQNVREVLRSICGGL